MTVCIALRSEGTLLLASDRMLTASDIQFEPRLSKTVFVTTAIAIMYSGDADFHSEILQELKTDVTAMIERNPDVWLNVKDVAISYLRHRNIAKSRRAESSILHPLNLDKDSFIALQHSMNADLARAVSEDLINYPVPELDVIVAGVDMRFDYPLPSIYVIQDGNISCADGVSFAAIGSGARHAESQFMLARYGFETPNAKALLTLFMGKKAAEIAPGVGSETDFWAIGPRPGQMFEIQGPLLAKVEREYERIREKEKRARKRAEDEVAQYVSELAEPTERGQVKSEEPKDRNGIDS